MSLSPGGKARAKPVRKPGKLPRDGNTQATLAQSAARLIEGLNPEQRAAADAALGPVLVLAGAGSGKTRVLVTRIVHLLGNCGAQPGEVTALTFSNRAAREMEARLSAYTGKAAQGVTLGTFHSLGLRMVRERAADMGLAPNPSVLDMHARLSLIVGQAARHGARNKKFDLFDLAQTLSRVKEQGHTPDTCPDDTEYGTRLARIYKGYEKAKHQANLVDFEDLIRMPIGLLRESAGARADYARRWKHFLVDEFQDTNQAQLDLLRLLVGNSGSVFVVGDDDQSIYAWRGAEMRNLLDFESHFPGAQVIKLQQNYRSTGHIIAASNAVIHRNLLRRPKTVFTARDSGEPLQHHVADDEKSEVDWLIAKLKDLNRSENLDWREMALLVRTNIQLRDWMDEFIVNGIPFAVKGANNLLEFPEVRAVLAYAKLLANPHDELSLSKVLAFPKRGWPKNILDQVPRSEGAVLSDLRAYCVASGHAWTADALKLLDQIEATQREAQAGIHAPLQHLLAAAGVLDAFAPKPAKAEADLDDDLALLSPEPGSDAEAKPNGTAGTAEAAAASASEAKRAERAGKKRERIEQFLRLFEREETRNPGARLAEVLNTLALDTQSTEDPEEKPGVRLMTVHAAKGLEFHTVFLPTLDDDTFPSKPNHTDVGIEEERRLFYVALTRAKRRLFLSWPATKVHYRVVRDVVPSRFLHEIPEQHWDGPLGKKDQEEKKEFIDNFFAALKADLEAP